MRAAATLTAERPAEAPAPPSASARRRSARRRAAGCATCSPAPRARRTPHRRRSPRPSARRRQPSVRRCRWSKSLNSLSVDIARAIDHDASIELWDRYRRGERDVFTRRLYTLKGQQTFDEIRRKYQSDGEFRAAVDRYCEDFEKLLKDVARNDRDNVMTQTYLTSDTGKVYTMLAHAARPAALGTRKSTKKGGTSRLLLCRSFSSGSITHRRLDESPAPGMSSAFGAWQARRTSHA